MCPCFAPSLKVHPSWDVKVCAGGPHHCFLAFLSIRMSCETLLPTFARKAEAHRSSAPDFGGRLSPNAPQSLRKREAAPRSVPLASFPFFAQLPRGRSAPAGCQAGRRPTARRAHLPCEPSVWSASGGTPDSKATFLALSRLTYLSTSLSCSSSEPGWSPPIRTRSTQCAPSCYLILVYL